MKANDDLIYRSALLEHIKDVPTWKQIESGWISPTRYPEGEYDPEDVISSIENAPAIDAKELIRCEKCRYYFDGVCKNPKNRIAIKVPDFGEHYAYMAELKVPKDHYCGYAERKKQ